jgi:hypothetical protein
MAGYYGGGITSGFNQGWGEGEAIVANTATFGQINSLNTYANSLQGGVYDWSRGFADVGVGSAYLATGGAIFEASPTLYVAAVNASQNPLTYVAAGAAAGGAYTYSQGGSAGDILYSAAASATMTYAAAPFPIIGNNNAPTPNLSVPSQLTAGQNYEAQVLAEQGLQGNQIILTPTEDEIQSPTFQAIVGPAQYTSEGNLVGTKFDSMTGGSYLEIKSGTSPLNSSYQLRLQTYFSVVNNVPYTIQTTRPLNPTFSQYLQFWGVNVQLPP